MSESNSQAPADALIAVLRSALGGDGSQSFNYMVLYTSFGIVRGRTGLTFSQEPANAQAAAVAGHHSGQEVIELYDATVEHHSNHLPTASYDRLYVRLGDVRGFALVGSQGQG